MLFAIRKDNTTILCMPPTLSRDSCKVEIYNAVRSKREIREPHEQNKLLAEVAIVAEEKKSMWAAVKIINNCNWQSEVPQMPQLTCTHTHTSTRGKVNENEVESLKCENTVAAAAIRPLTILNTQTHTHTHTHTSTRGTKQ